MVTRWICFLLWKRCMLTIKFFSLHMRGKKFYIEHPESPLIGISWRGVLERKMQDAVADMCARSDYHGIRPSIIVR